MKSFVLNLKIFNGTSDKMIFSSCSDGVLNRNAMFLSSLQVSLAMNDTGDAFKLRTLTLVVGEE